MARVFSRDPLSWGQIVFLWLGGMLVVAPALVAGLVLLDRAADETRDADDLFRRADWHDDGRLAPGEFRGRSFRLSPSWGEVSARDSTAERLDAEHLADSLSFVAAAERHIARRHVRAARLHRLGASLALLVAVVSMGFLIGRSFHAAAREPDRPRT